MQLQSTPVRLASHVCGCFIEYATDSRGDEYPLEVNGCSANDEMLEAYLSLPEEKRISNSSFISMVKNHRGREVA
jgi:hypothetical protein